VERRWGCKHSKGHVQQYWISERACVEDSFVWTSSRERMQGIASQMTDLCYCTFYDFSSFRPANLQEGWCGRLGWKEIHISCTLWTVGEVYLKTPPVARTT